MFTEEMVRDSPNPSKIMIDEYPDFTYENNENKYYHLK